jgi:hypothetical protein
MPTRKRRTVRYLIQVQSTIRNSLWYDVQPVLAPKALAKFKALRKEYDRSPSGRKLILRLIRRVVITTETIIWPILR